MKRLPLALTALIVPAAIGLAVAASAATDTPQPNAQPFFGGPCAGYGQGMGPGAGWGQGMGPGHGAGWGMGPGMHRANWRGGPGPMGSDDFREQRRAWRADANHDGTVTIDEVKAYLEARHDRPGFENLKVGAVKEKDDNTITADIVTKDDSLVRTLEFARKVETQAMGPGAGFGPGMGGRQGFGGRGFNGPVKGFGDRGGFQAGMSAGLLADGQVSVDEVKGLMEQRLAMWKNPNLKVGEVKVKDDTTITADIVTKDGSLVDRLDFDRKTGRSAPER